MKKLVKKQGKLNYNKRILKLIQEYLIKYPDQRFGQALINLYCISDNDLLNYNLESKDIYKRMKEKKD